jgi:hypothetical protein
MTDQTPVDPTPPASPPAPDPAPPAAPPAAPPPSNSNIWTPPASGAPAAAARPTGITILAILAGIGGVLGLLGGFALFLGGTVLFGAAGALFGLAALALAALSLAFSWGAWTLQAWAWPLGVAGRWNCPLDEGCSPWVCRGIGVVEGSMLHQTTGGCCLMRGALQCVVCPKADWMFVWIQE